ncbi:flagellar basal-body MS-ring/collar protein FliF [Marinovum sp.]|uniref:flagellar basal-body MS-ring/collar protein FliF n=1 Tax=Marinovum sp. TaxID=2024839 RepID=UPI002B27059C|nr:flagellar basal-body MS-ring/collar protein FliF [Marinovum sp.]
MDQFAKTWAALSVQKKIGALVAGLGMFAAVFFMSRMAATPNMALLYAGLENGAAGEVVRALEQRGLDYEIRGGSIFVPSNHRDELRLTLASEGLPANSTKGYELLDQLSGFGTTSQMFDAAYWRAKEGELARTILSSPGVTAARVHIANASTNPFRRESENSASVFITTASGALSPQQAKSLKYLVSSAVPGLAPEKVAVIDSAGGLVLASEDDAPASVGDERAMALREAVTRLVEARVGFGNAVVEVSVDTVTESESIRERRIDPDSRVAISTDTEERSNTAQEAGGGDVTVASNLPDGEGAGGGESQSQGNETRERVNYEVSETEREVIREPGAIKRLTVAVLVNGTRAPDETGAEAFTPLPETEIAALRELVASAVGFDQARGDEITIRSLAFEPISEIGTEAAPGMLSQLPFNIAALVQMAVLGLVALILGLFVLRPIFRNPPPQDVLSLPPSEGAAPARSAAAAADPGAGAALDGEIDDGEGGFITLNPVRPDPGEAGEIARQDVPPADPVERLRGLINERQEETVEILRGWLDDTGEKA